MLNAERLLESLVEAGIGVRATPWLLVKVHELSTMGACVAVVQSCLQSVRLRVTLAHYHCERAEVCCSITITQRARSISTRIEEMRPAYALLMLSDLT